MSESKLELHLIEESSDKATKKYMLIWDKLPRRFPDNDEVLGIMRAINPNAGLEVIRHTDCSLWFKVQKTVAEADLRELKQRIQKASRPRIAA